MRKHIFNAGPCKLPDSTLENVSKAVIEFGNTGQSILEVSHRSSDFQAVYDEAVRIFSSFLRWWCQHAILHDSLQLLEKESCLC